MMIRIFFDNLRIPVLITLGVAIDINSVYTSALYTEQKSVSQA